MPTSRPQLSPAQRRRKIIELISAALISIPTAYAVPGKPPTKKPSKDPSTCLDVLRR